MPQPTQEELSTFMAALRLQESSNDYGAIGTPVGDSRGVARGAYQIMSGYWDAWASQAGYANADWRVPEIQDAVAEHKLRQYYDDFDGRWDLVAVSWFAGPGTAQEAEKRGIESFRGMEDNIGQNVAKYAEEVMQKFGNEAASRGVTASTPTVDENLNVRPGETFGDVQARRQQRQAEQDVAQQQPPNRTPARMLAQASFDQISRFIQANAGNPQAHERMRKAMGNIFGRSRQAQPSVDVQAAEQAEGPSAAPSPPSVEANVPTEAPGTGQSGVR